MRNSVLILLAGVIFGSSCSSGPPRQIRHDAVLTGEQTAQKAGDAAREAARKDDTGLIYASSNRGEPDRAADAPSADDDAAVEAPENLVTVEITGEGLSVAGQVKTEEELVAELTSQLESEPELIVVLTPAEGVPSEQAVALEARIRDAGVKHVQGAAGPEKSDDAPAPTGAPVDEAQPADQDK